MILGIWVAVGLVSLAILIGLIRVATATDGASRAVVGDLVFFSAVALLILLGVVKESAAVVDAALLASLVGILATIALARILTRGQR